MSLKVKKTILITGGTGFLGSHILKQLIADNYNVLVLVRISSELFRIKDVVDKASLHYIERTDFNKLFKENRIGIVIHCATNYGRRQTEPLSILEANLILPLKLLQVGAENGLSCFINTDTVLDKRISHYSLSKSQFKDWLKLYSDRMLCINVALEHFYGPGDDPSKFVTWAIHALLTNTKSLDLTLGEQKRDFIFISDIANAFRLIINSSKSQETGYIPFEIGTGQAISIRKLLLIIKQLTKNTTTKLNFGALPYRENEVMVSATDLTNIKALGWRTEVSLNTGLKKTIEFEKKVLLK